MFAGCLSEGITALCSVKSSAASDPRWMAHPQPSDAATPVVSAFYDRFPFPGDPLQDGPPPGYNWFGAIAAFWRLFTAPFRRGSINRAFLTPVAAQASAPITSVTSTQEHPFWALTSVKVPWPWPANVANAPKRPGR